MNRDTVGTEAAILASMGIFGVAPVANVVTSIERPTDRGA